MTIQQAEDRNLLIGWQLSTDSQDVKETLQYLNKYQLAKIDNYGIDGLFTKQKDGEFTHIYGFRGIIPNMDKELFRLKGSITKQP